VTQEVTLESNFFGTDKCGRIQRRICFGAPTQMSFLRLSIDGETVVDNENEKDLQQYQQTGPAVVYLPSLAQPFRTLTESKEWALYSSIKYTYRHTYLQCVQTFLGG
jgi:hypothetical protein